MSALHTPQRCVMSRFLEYIVEAINFIARMAAFRRIQPEAA